MPTPKKRHTSSVHLNQIYTFGGDLFPSIPTDVVESYDTLTNTWGTHPSLGTPRMKLTSATVGDKIYVIGGSDVVSTSPIIYGVMEEFDPILDKFTNCGIDAPGNDCRPLPTPRWAATSSIVNGKIYVIGGLITVPGNINQVPVNIVEEYDPATNTWTNCGTPAPENACASMPNTRGVPTSSVVNNLVYVIGRDGNSITSIDIYDPVGNSWVSGRDMPVDKGYITSCSHNNKLFIPGGTISSVQKTVHVYDPASNSWNEDFDLPQAITDSSCVLANGFLYLLGGESGNPVLSTVYRYDPFNP